MTDLKQKPKMPEEAITFPTGEMTLSLDSDYSRFSSGGMRMTIGAVTISETIDGEEKQLGSINGTMGGGVVISFEKGRSWYLSPKEIWRAVAKAEDAYKKTLEAEGDDGKGL